MGVGVGVFQLADIGYTTIVGQQSVVKATQMGRSIGKTAMYACSKVNGQQSPWPILKIAEKSW